MPLRTSSRDYEIEAGAAVTAVVSTTLLGLGPTGDATARRRLVHPTPASFAPIVYYTNPDRTFNMDNEALLAPIVSVVRTLGSSAVLRYDELEADVIVTEVWTASETKASMPGFFFRQLYEYLLNPPAFSPTNPVWIQWSPQDRNAKTWNVELLRLAVGAGGEAQVYDVTELLPRNVAEVRDLDDAFVNEGGGVLDRQVALSMKLVSEVTT